MGTAKLVLVTALVACGGGRAAAPVAGAPVVAPPVVAPPAPAPVGPRLPVEDVFTITGHGTVVTGRLAGGALQVGDAVEVVGLRPTQPATVKALEMFRKVLERAAPGDNVGVLLGGVGPDDVERGQVLCAPGACVAASALTADLALVASDAGGRRTPIADGYRPQVLAGTATVSGTVTLPAGTAALAPGAAARVALAVDRPIVVAPGDVLELREGGHVVGRATVITAAP